MYAHVSLINYHVHGSPKLSAARIISQVVYREYSISKHNVIVVHAPVSKQSMTALQLSS